MISPSFHTRQAYLVLFVSVLIGVFLVSLPVWMVFLHPKRIGIFPLFFLLAFHFSAIFGYPAIDHYRMRECPRFRRIVFFAAIIGSSIAFYLTFEQMKGTFAEEISNTVVIVFGILSIFWLGYGLTRSMVQRTRYLFSEKTNNWLQSYVTKTHIVNPSKETALDPLSIHEVLQDMQATKKRFNIYALTLFLDTIPEGEHWLCLEKTDFYIFGLNITRRKMFFRIDWSQVEEIRTRFGGFRKTIFISTLSREKYSRVG